jgi:hypothetical protein
MFGVVQLMISAMKTAFALLLALLLGCAAPGASQGSTPGPLRVSENGRFLVQDDGTPFVWLGDTAWALFEKAVLEPTDAQPAVDLYFKTRAAQGFTVVQAALIFEGWKRIDGLTPFEDDRSTPRAAYWDVVGKIIDRAAAHGIRIAALPAWMVDVPHEHPLVKEPAVAYRYGRYLGGRFRSNVIWVMGGDPYKNATDVDNPPRLAMTRAIAEGIADGHNGVDRPDGQADWTSTLMTFHPKGGNHSSSERLHGEPWLDFNMIQTTTSRDFANYKTVERDYAKTPVKPTFDSEVAYEASHSLGGSTKEPPMPRISPWEVRRAAYWNVFAGGFGHTYGHRSYIRWTLKGEKLKFGAETPWYEALEAPGALQMGHLKRLLLSRPFLKRVPDQGLIDGEAGAGREHKRATRGDGYALVYLPAGGSVRVKHGFAAVRAWWFDPRDGSAKEAAGTAEFQAPTSGEGQDWVLVVDDAARAFPPPGR